MRQPNPVPEAGEIQPLTGIRGFAVWMVVLGHFYGSWVILLPGVKLLQPLAQRGQLGVDLFFVLSGFILSYVYDVGGVRLDFARYRKFVWFRLARIYPMHLAMLGAAALLAGLGPRWSLTIDGSYPMASLPYQLTMTHAWIVAHNFQWNYPSWSISAEWFAYLVIFPLAGIMLRWHLRASGFLSVAYGALGGWLMLLYFFDGEVFWRYGALWRVSLEFIAGSALFGIYRRESRITGWCQKYATAVFLCLLICVFTLALVPGKIMHLLRFIPCLFLPVLLLGLTGKESAFARLLSTPLALFFGRISYAVYMCHAVMHRLIYATLPAEQFATSPLTVRLFLLLANLALITGVATGAYYLVELPARNLMRRLK